MRKLLTYILKCGFYNIKRNNILQMTENECFEQIKRNLSYGIFLSLIFMPMMIIIIAILKLLGYSAIIPKPIALLIAIVSIYLMVKPVRKKLDSISLDELTENDISVQKKLSLQYYWVVLGILGIAAVAIYFFRLLYFSLK